MTAVTWVHKAQVTMAQLTVILQTPPPPRKPQLFLGCITTLYLQSTHAVCSALSLSHLSISSWAADLKAGEEMLLWLILNVPLWKHQCMFQGCHPSAFNATISQATERRESFSVQFSAVLAPGSQNHTGWAQKSRRPPVKTAPMASFLCVHLSCSTLRKIHKHHPSLSERTTVQAQARKHFSPPTPLPNKQKQICKDIALTKTQELTLTKRTQLLCLKPQH